MQPSSQQDAVCALLTRSILELCRASFVFAGFDVDVDGLICVTTHRASGRENVVIKIHDRLYNKTDAPALTSRDLESHDVTENGSSTGRSAKRKATPLFSPVSPKVRLTLASHEHDTTSPRDVSKPKVAKKATLSDVVSNLAESARAKDEEASEEEAEDDASASLRCTPLPPEHEQRLLSEITSQLAQDRPSTSSTSLATHQPRTIRPHRPVSPSGLDRKDSLWKGKPMKCGSCGLQLRSKRYLLEHMRDHARAAQQPLNSSPFSCISCNLVFPYFSVFRQHRAEQHAQAHNCRCDNCDLHFTFKEFKSHEHECLTASHAQLVSDVSNADDVSGVQRAELLRTVRPPLPHTIAPTVGGGESGSKRSTPSTNQTSPASDAASDALCSGPYRCQSCFVVIESFKEFSEHNQELHSRFVCVFCAQSFASKRNLRRHTRRHTGYKPYTCGQCDATFTRDDDLKKHLRRAHDWHGAPNDDDDVTFGSSGVAFEPLVISPDSAQTSNSTLTFEASAGDDVSVTSSVSVSEIKEEDC